MTKREAYKRIVAYVIAHLEAGRIGDDEKEQLKAADYERMCKAAEDFAAELRRRYAI